MLGRLPLKLHVLERHDPCRSRGLKDDSVRRRWRVGSGNGRGGSSGTWRSRG